MKSCVTHLKAIFSGSVGHCSPLSGGIDVRVRATSIAINVALLLELDSVFLLVGSSKCAVTGEITRVTDYRCRVRGLMVRLLRTRQSEEEPKRCLKLKKKQTQKQKNKHFFGFHTKF